VCFLALESMAIRQCSPSGQIGDQMLEKQYIANIANAITKEALRLQPPKEMSVEAMIVVESLEVAKVFFDRLKRQGAFED
jgi:hypothetical protein